MRFQRSLFAGVLAFSGLAGPAFAQPALAELGLPVECALKIDCFVQQLPDMAPGPAVEDPFCARSSYDGHDGLDIRLRSLSDMARGVPVVASAAGRVRGARDGMDDRLVQSEADRTALANRECGNGVVLDHGDAQETQYCHMRNGSVAVQPGQTVAAGQKLGEIGASGLAQFPHVHFSVRVHGQKMDPISGRRLDAGCVGPDALTDGLFSERAAAQLSADNTALLDMGLAGAPIEYESLVISGAPSTPAAGAPATIAWGWFINLRQGDVIRSKLISPDGAVFFEGSGEPLDRDKASYASVTGRRQPLASGRWTVELVVLRDGEPAIRETRSVDIE